MPKDQAHTDAETESVFIIRYRLIRNGRDDYFITSHDGDWVRYAECRALVMEYERLKRNSLPLQSDPSKCMLGDDSMPQGTI